MRVPRKILYAVTVFGLTAILLCKQVPGQAADASQPPPEWSTPKSVALQKISGLSSAQTQPNFLSNLDCTLLTYRMVADSTMQTGCFSQSAYGLVDTDSEHVIFNGTDEGLNLTPYSGHEVLIPWPGALDLLAADTAATGGSYLSLYKNPLAHIKDERNYLGQLVAKRLTAPPELHLTDAAGQPLIVNLQTLAFSDGGSWLVAEMKTGSFIRFNLATLDEVAFAPAFGTTGSPGLLKSTVAITDSGQFVAIANDVDSSFKVYDLTKCTSSTSCLSYNYWPFVKQRLGGLQGISHVRFIHDGLIQFEAISSVSGESGTYLLAPSGSITTLTDYIGLGDSYTSGEGAFDYRSGTDTADNHCHTSGLAYPALLTRDLFTASGGHSVACSGATISDIGNTSPNYRGQVAKVLSYGELQKNQPALLASVLLNYLPGYIAQHRFVKQYQPRVVTVSVGGDDVGFGDIVETCAVPHLSIHLSDNTCFNSYEDRLELIQQIDRTVGRWKALFKQLAGSTPSGHVFAVGYPDIISDTGNCALNVHLNQSEREFAKEIVVYLNGAIKQAAAGANVTYVDISQALAGHRLCETASFNVAVNGLTAGTDAGLFGVNVIGKESFHPNAFGQLLIEQEILRQSHNLAAATTTTATASDTSKILDKPKTGRIVKVRTPATITRNRVTYRGKQIAVSVDGPSHGLVANTSYQVTIGATGQVVGTIVSGEDGSLSGTITIPSYITDGEHSIDVIGSNQNGEQVDAVQPIYISNSQDDADGDSTPDTVDGCPTAKNSGVDEDQDGIDDACDGLIGQPPASSSTNTSNPSGQPGGSAGNTQYTDAGSSGANLQPAGNAQSVIAGESLAPETLTVVGTILSSLPTDVPATPITAVKLEGGRSLGIATVNPINAGRQGGLVITNTDTTTYRAPLRTFHWIRWALLAMIAWWLIVLCAWLANYLRRSKQERSSWQVIYAR